MTRLNVPVFLAFVVVGCCPQTYYTKQLIHEDWKCESRNDTRVFPPTDYTWDDLISQNCSGGSGCSTCWAHSKVVKVPYLFSDERP